ncbi:hypothetical protein R1sor_023841 [Riccia sorocarpa]|uniref:Myb/SANT-like DNA-binding domain-containing protein n=1 Tax=Riccia sorocarpa TaxID=122646 RepID=A0ABD3GS06_9MARC
MVATRQRGLGLFAPICVIVNLAMSFVVWRLQIIDVKGIDRPVPLRPPYLQPQFLPLPGLPIPTTVPVGGFTRPMMENVPGIRSPTVLVDLPAEDLPECPSRPAVNSGNRANRAGKMQWDQQSTIALIELKKDEWEAFESMSSRRGQVVSSDVKWQKIKEGLLARGIDAEASQIRSKWDRLYGEFKRVRDWNKVSRNEAYWACYAKTKKNEQLPSNFNEEIYDLLSEFTRRRPGVNPTGISYTNETLL